MRITTGLLLAFILMAPQAGLGDGLPKASSAPQTNPMVLGGLHNVYRITDNLYSGSSPEGEAGFRSLQKLGIKTIISVDGMRPDLDTAHQYHLRYVHLPFGYDGIPRQRILELAKAVRDLPGPLYLHCHHGVHRGPAAAAAIHLCLDPKCTVEQALAEMRRAGTDPHYAGLYAVPTSLVRPSAEELDHLSADFRETARVADLAQIMVGIDLCRDHLKLARAAGWRRPSEQPDIDPPHEALQLVEHYREASRLEAIKARPEEFRHWLAEAVQQAEVLEGLLRVRKEADKTEEPGAAFRKVEASCTRCHAKYRDVPHTKAESNGKN